MSQEPDHIADKGSQGEALALERLFANGIPAESIFPGWDRVFPQLSLPWDAVGLQIPTRLISSEAPETDIDVCLIPMNWELGAGSIEASYDLRHIVAFETKVLQHRDPSYDRPIGVEDTESESNEDISEHQQDGRDTAETLCQLGFNRVALFYILSSKPLPVKRPWMAAGAMVNDVSDTAAEALRAKGSDSFDTIMASVAPALLEREEHLSGASSPLRVINEGSESFPRTPFRERLESKLRGVLPTEFGINNPPQLILACQTCGTLYTSFQGVFDECECGGISTIAHKIRND